MPIAARDSRIDGILLSLKKRLGVDKVIYWPMTKETQNRLDPEEIEKRAREYPPESQALDALHGGAANPLAMGHAAPLGWALSREAAQETFDFADKAHTAYADPEQHHAYRDETKLIRALSTSAARK